MHPFNKVLLLIIGSFFLFNSILVYGYGSPPDFAQTDTNLNHLVQNSNSVPLYIIKTKNDSIHRLDQYIGLFKEPAQRIDIRDLIHSKNAYPFSPFDQDFKLNTATAYWMGLRIKNETGQELENWVLHLGIINEIEVYLVNEQDSLLMTQQTGRSVPASKKQLQFGNRQERIHINLKPNELIQLYFRIKNTNGYAPRIQVALSAEDYTKSKFYSWERLLDGLFIGFLLSLIAFNLIFHITTRDIAFFYQFIFVISVLIFMIDIMDLICDFPVLRNHPLWLEPINFGSLIILNISYLLFVSKFINVDSVFPHWTIILRRLIGINSLFGIGIILFYVFTHNERITDTAIALVSTTQYVILTILLFQFYQIRDRKSYFILIATLFLIGGVLVDGICITLGISVPVNFSKWIVLGNVSFFFFGMAYRMKILKEEEQMAIRLKENQELKNQLYANITHEFRTPLTVIQGMAQQIESKNYLPGSSILQNAIFLIKSNTNKLLNLVNTILDLAKIESGKMGMKYIHGDIIPFLRYTIQSFESFADSKKIYLQFLTELDHIEMDYDRHKLQQIISNLISNAIKFTPAGGKISFVVKRIDSYPASQIYLEVKDTGEGIPQDEISNLFDRFFQVAGSTKKEQGSGLGLALVKELVQVLDGTITVESKLDEGTSFRILLPIRSTFSSSQQENFELEQDENYLQNESLLSMSKSSDLERTATLSSDPRKSDKPLLLIIDDNKDIVYYLTSLLDTDYDIESAYTGADGLQIAQDLIPDIILSDILMPGKDGYELCEILKSDERTDHIPVVLLTAKSDAASRISGLRAGADAYVSKPFDEIELKALLTNLLNQRNALQEHYKKVLQQSTNLNEASKPKEDPFLVKLNEIIVEKMEDEDFGILHMCRAMQMSRTQLHRKITALTGMSASIYLRSKRLQKAKRLLKESDLNISQIAFSVGFGDPNYFTRVFSEEFNMTPSNFRIENK